MGNSKKASIYKPKKGKRISQKKLYKMPQKGGGFLETFLGGNEDPKPEKEEENISMDIEEKPEEENSAMSVEEKSEGENSDMSVEEKPKGIMETVGDSVKNTASEIQTAFTGPSAEENQDSEEATIDNMEPTPEAQEERKEETMESLREKNQELLEKLNELHEKYEKLQEEQLASLKGTTPLGEGAEEDPFATTEINNGPSVTEGETSLDTGYESMNGDMSVENPSAMDGDMSVENPSAMDGDMSVENPSAMDGDMSMGSVSLEGDMSSDPSPTMDGDMNVESSADTGSEYVDDAGAPVKPTEEDERQMGGTKRRKNKQRKTKRKRKGSKK